MKKSIVFALLLTIGAAMTAASCQSKKTEERNATVETVAEKAQNKEKLTQEEYAAAIDYLEDGYKECLEVFNSRDKRNPAEYSAKIKTLNEKFMYVAELQELLEKEPPSLDEANTERYNKMLAARDSLRKYVPQAIRPADGSRIRSKIPVR